MCGLEQADPELPWAPQQDAEKEWRNGLGVVGGSRFCARLTFTQSHAKHLGPLARLARVSGSLCGGCPYPLLFTVSVIYLGADTDVWSNDIQIFIL